MSIDEEGRNTIERRDERERSVEEKLMITAAAVVAMGALSV
jgi:hypothetical protein